MCSSRRDSTDAVLCAFRYRGPQDLLASVDAALACFAAPRPLSRDGDDRVSLRFGCDWSADLNQSLARRRRRDEWDRFGLVSAVRAALVAPVACAAQLALADRFADRLG